MPLPLADDLRGERTVHGRKYYNGLAATPWPISEEIFCTYPASPRYEGGFSFVRSVQPVLDRYCISCHGLNKVEKDINLLVLPDSLITTRTRGART